jgi:hypothetical protein
MGHAARFSRVFPYPDLKTPLPRGIDPRWLIRWNGLPGTVGTGSLEGPAMAQADKLLWAKEPKLTVMAAVPFSPGGGRILFAQLDLKSHLRRTEASYDPVAERMLLGLLEGSF